MLWWSVFMAVLCIFRVGLRAVLVVSARLCGTCFAPFILAGLLRRRITYIAGLRYLLCILLLSDALRRCDFPGFTDFWWSFFSFS